MAKKQIDKARQYKPSTIRRLDTLSGNQCAEPSCERPCIAKDGKSIISKICHIEAASPEGARYNPNMSDDERRHFDNLILLCDECHTIIDNKENEAEYPVPLLKKWKKDHEAIQLTKLVSNPTLLGAAINAIIAADFEGDEANDPIEASSFDIAEKIEYNAVKRNKPLIEEYKVFHAKISAIYSELENQGSFKKEKLLRKIRNAYLRAKGRYVDDSTTEIEKIRDHADDIIEDIEEELLKSIESDKQNYAEDLSFGITMVMVDAFMRCKILEEPQKND